MLYIPACSLFISYTRSKSQLCLIPWFIIFLNDVHVRIATIMCGSISSPSYDTRFLELVLPRLAVLDRRDRTGVAVVGDVSLEQPCWSRISVQPLLPVFLAIIMAVLPWLSFALTSIPYCGETDAMFISKKQSYLACSSRVDIQTTRLSTIFLNQSISQIRGQPRDLMCNIVACKTI